MKRLLVLLPLLLAGCSSSSGGSPVAAPTPSATTSAASGAGSAPSPSATTATSTSTKPAGTPRCHTADLGVTKGSGGAAAGTESINLVFTNKTKHSCTLYGYPGVSWVAGDNGTQVNAPFSREAGGTAKKTITLAAGAVGSALLLWPNEANFDAAQCKPADVRGYRIYPPDEKASVFVDSPQKVCSAQGVGTGRVQPIVKGAGEPG